MDERERQPDIGNGLDEAALADHDRGEVGSGTPGDKAGLGGGDAGRTPTGTASPGGEGRA